MKRAALWLLVAVTLAAPLTVLLIASPARADMDDIELRKRQSWRKLGFGFIGLYELAVGLNRDRPEGSNFLYFAPQLKIGDRMRVRLNFGFTHNWFDRQENPWDFMDIQLQFGHLGFYKEKHTGVDFSGHVRYYIPVSIQSRNEGSFGQLRGTGKASRTFWDKLYVAFELNLQKYFHRYTTWASDESQASWDRGGGRDEYNENNASFGFGETFTATYTPISGLDLTVMYGFIQTRQYGGEPAVDADGRSYGSSLVVDSRLTRWSYATRLILDATVGLSMLPWWKGKYVKDKILDRMFVSVGYSNMSPTLYQGYHHYSPFDPKFAQAYFDLMVLY